MTSWIKSLVVVLALGASGLGCELVLYADRSRLDEPGGSGGSGGSGGMASTSDASCTDAVKNGAETDVDCGGGTCGTCAAGKTCAVDVDCASATCKADKTCM